MSADSSDRREVCFGTCVLEVDGVERSGVEDEHDVVVRICGLIYPLAKRKEKKACEDQQTRRDKADQRMWM